MQTPCINRYSPFAGGGRADEVPLCAITGVDGWGVPTCSRNRAKDLRANFCQGQADPSNCARYQQFQALDNQARAPACPNLVSIPARC